MTKKFLAAAALSIFAALGISTYAQDTAGQVFITGEELVYNADAGTITIFAPGNLLPFNYVDENGEIANIWFNGDEFIGGWGDTPAGEDIEATGALVVEQVIDGDLVSALVPLNLSGADAVRTTVNQRGVISQVTFNVGELELPKDVLDEAATDFMLIVDYTPDFAEAILPAIEAWVDANRVTTSRPCNPRTLC